MAAEVVDAGDDLLAPAVDRPPGVRVARRGGGPHGLQLRGEAGHLVGPEHVTDVQVAGHLEEPAHLAAVVIRAERPVQVEGAVPVDQGPADVGAVDRQAAQQAPHRRLPALPGRQAAAGQPGPLRQQRPARCQERSQQLGEDRSVDLDDRARVLGAGHDLHPGRRRPPGVGAAPSDAEGERGHPGEVGGDQMPPFGDE